MKTGRLRISAENSNKAMWGGVVCAFMVAMIHIPLPRVVGSAGWWFDKFVSHGFCMMAVPFFFVMSGYFIGLHTNEKSWWILQMKKRVRTLLVPYLLLNVLFFLWQLIAMKSPVVVTGIADAVNVALGNVYSYPILVPLWYVRTLLLFIVCTPLLCWVLKPYLKIFAGNWIKQLSGVILGYVIMCYCVKYAYKVPSVRLKAILNYTFVVRSLFYYLLGLALSEIGIPKVDRRIGYISLCLGLLILLAKIYSLKMPPFLRDVASADVCFVIALWTFLPHRALPEFLKGLSFPIFTIHWFVLIVLWRFGFNPELLTGCVGNFAVMIVASVVIVKAVNGLFPSVSRILWGGRA